MLTHHSIRMRHLVVILVLAVGLTGAVRPSPAYPADSSGDDDIFRVGGDVLTPVKIHAPAPVYTEAARKERIQGQVVVEAVIDENGAIVALKLLEGQSHGLSAEAMASVVRWRFEPATLKGQPVKVYYNLTINFRLE